MEPNYIHSAAANRFLISERGNVLQRQGGFTLIELMVVFAIISVITGLVFTSQGSFNKTIVLTNTAYDIALSLRSVETYGLGGRATSGATNIGYGIHFDKTAPNVFMLFADAYPGPSTVGCHGVSDSTKPDAQSGNCVYSPGNDSVIANYKIGNGVFLKNICAKQNTGSWLCSANNALSSLDIVFGPSSPDPFIHVNANDTSLPVYTDACLTVSSPHGGEKYVSVAASGSIHANAQSCP